MPNRLASRRPRGAAPHYAGCFRPCVARGPRSLRKGAAGSLINAGHKPREIAELVQLRKSLKSYFGARGDCGEVRHNVKAIYQFYLGAYDGNPAKPTLTLTKAHLRQDVGWHGGCERHAAQR